MGTTYYYTANNEMIGEHTLGQSRIDYLTDSLGSIVTTVDQSLTVVSTARYKPYGADLATTGTTPSFGYVGSPGYRRTKLPHADLYIRSRTYATAEGMFTTQVAMDEMISGEHPYGYANENPEKYVDPSGNSPMLQRRGKLSGDWDKPGCLAAAAAAASALSSCFSQANTNILSQIMQCIAYGESDCNQNDSSLAKGLYQLSNSQYSHCAPADCKNRSGNYQRNCGIFNKDCNTKATVGLIVAMLDHPGTFSGDNLGDVLCQQFGVLYPCANTNRNGPQHGNTKTMRCLKAKGINIFNVPLPPRLSTCPKCPKDPFRGMN